MENQVSKRSLSHRREDETLQAKARWLKSLTVDERMQLLNEWTNFIMEVNPDIAARKSLPTWTERVQVLSLPQLKE